MSWWMWGIPVATLAIGVAIGRLTGRWNAHLWRVRAVEMARMNNALLDRVEVLEEEHQKED